MPKDICLAVDAMGGDFGPEIINEISPAFQHGPDLGGEGFSPGKAAAIGKRIRGDVENSHDQRTEAKG